MTRVFIDVETTGLDPKTCSIIELGYIIVKDGKEVEKGIYNMKPFFGETLSDDLSKKLNLTNEEIQNFPDQTLAYNDFIEKLNKYIDISKYGDKAYFCAYNASFDMDFVREWFLRNNNSKFGYYFWFPYLDVMALASFILVDRRSHLRNFQLTTIYKEITGKTFDNAHNALADIEATKDLFNILTAKIYQPAVRSRN